MSERIVHALPNLAGVATDDLVQQIGAGSYAANYINWSRTMHLLRLHAPGWLPELVPAGDGGVVHLSPIGGFLYIRFRHMDGSTTPPIPQAIMDNRNNAIPYDKINARDITDTHRRGLCMAAALTFGLAYELWAKMPLESGYADTAPPSTTREVPRPTTPPPKPAQGQTPPPAPPKRNMRQEVMALAKEWEGSGKAELIVPAVTMAASTVFPNREAGSPLSADQYETLINFLKVAIATKKWGQTASLDDCLGLMDVARFAAIHDLESWELTTEQAQAIITHMEASPFESQEILI